MNSERELAERLAAHGCDTGLSRNGRLVRFDDRACKSMPADLADQVLACTALREITLHHSPAAIASRLEALSRLEKLQSLDLENTDLDDDGLARLSQLRQLRILNVRGTRVTPGQVARLRKEMIQTRIIY